MLREELEFVDKEIGVLMTSYPATELFVCRQCANVLNKIGCLRKKRHTAATELSAQINNLGGMQKFKATCFRWKRMARSPAGGFTKIAPRPATEVSVLFILLNLACKL